jgi:hypothetical protein
LFSSNVHTTHIACSDAMLGNISGIERKEYKLTKKKFFFLQKMCV